MLSVCTSNSTVVYNYYLNYLATNEPSTHYMISIIIIQNTTNISTWYHINHMIKIPHNRDNFDSSTTCTA